MESIWFATHPMPAVPPADLADGAHHDTVVAGAGLAGLTTAALLARSGQRVAVVEARSVGAVATGNTTAKVSLLQGDVLSNIARRHGDEVIGAYLEANREGQAWLLRFLDERGIACDRRTAWTYATTDDGMKKLRSEFKVASEAGLDVTWSEDTELPFDVRGAISLPDQAQIHPLELLQALATDLAAHGGIILEDTRVLDADVESAGVRIATSRGELRADRLVLATGIPVLDRGGYFAKVVPMRSYATAHRVPGQIPRGMYLSLDHATRSLRTVRNGEEELLVVGGNGHVVGRSQSEAAALADLEDWTREHFPGSSTTHTWSAQDYRAANRLPHVGPMSRGSDRIFVATGFNKWGMTNAVAAALNLSGQILGGHMPWAETLSRPSTGAATVVSALGANISVAAELARDWVDAELQEVPDAAPREGQGRVGRGVKGRPEAVSTVAGRTCRVSGVCTHLGGVLRWNDAEKSWDCPLHGSRFTPDGAVLEEPAVEGLERRG